MGSSRRQSSFEHHDRGFQAEVQKTARVTLGSASKPHHVRSGHSETRDICSGLVGERSDKGNRGENSTTFFSSLYKGKEERKATSSH